MRDIATIEYFFRLMEEASMKLEKSFNSGNIEEVEKLKKIILEISNKISEELK